MQKHTIVFPKFYYYLYLYSVHPLFVLLLLPGFRDRDTVPTRTRWARSGRQCLFTAAPCRSFVRYSCFSGEFSAHRIEWLELQCSNGLTASVDDIIVPKFYSLDLRNDDFIHSRCQLFPTPILGGSDDCRKCLSAILEWYLSICIVFEKAHFLLQLILIVCNNFFYLFKDWLS